MLGLFIYLDLTIFSGDTSKLGIEELFPFVGIFGDVFKLLEIILTGL